MGVARAMALLERRALSAEDLVGQCLSRIAEREPAVRAWEIVNAEGALREARRIDAMPRRPLLCGVPVAVKDLIDTKDLPTAYGSPIHRGHQPAFDAACVAALRRAGAVVLGKTVTTEFAVYQPGKTHNPRDLARTPGGSSSGSAAAVADGMVPFALGTQTAASVVRPASFCGVIGWKLAHGAVSLDGVHPLSPSLDTLGFFVRELADVAPVLEALTGARTVAAVLSRPVLALCRTEAWDRAEPSTHAAVEAAAARFAAGGAEVREVALPEGLVQAQIDIMGAEAAVSLRDKPQDQLSPKLRAFLAAGREVSSGRLRAAHALAAQGRARLRALLDQVDAIFTPAAAGEAPPGLGATGDPLFSRIWSLLGAPSCSLPLLQGPLGLPLGLQLIARDDARLLGVAGLVAPTEGG